MKTKHILLVVASILLMLPVGAQTADQILDKVDQLTSAPQDARQTIRMTLVDRNGRQQVRTAMIWQKGKNKRLIKFTSPAAYKGIAFLSLPNDVMYVYMPAYGKERRIASSVKNQKFAGTDLTYEDLQAKSYKNKYNARLLSKDANQFVLELMPKERSQYSKVILTVNKNYLPVKAEFFNRGNQKVKVLTFNFVKSGNYWYAKTLTAKDLRTKHTTKMEVITTQFDTGLSDNIFSIRFMKQ